jgi:dCMP deaminase
MTLTLEAWLHFKTGYAMEDPMTYRRPSVTETMMTLAGVMSERSTCPSATVGAVIAQGDSVIAIGYNGAPRGMAHCSDVGCVVIPAQDYDIETFPPTRVRTREYSRHVHAEVNAILQCARDGRSTEATLYATMFPCLDCAKAIIQAGIRTVVVPSFAGAHGGKNGPVDEFLRLGGVDVLVWNQGNTE